MNVDKPQKIRAIIGLGNVGNRYSHNRHNIGFRVVDALATSSWRDNDLMDYTEAFIGDSNVILIKPRTFMNDSGKVLPFLTKKGIGANEVVVVHDELEKKFGYVGIKLGGSARGHNGLRSIINFIGKDFWRVRFGVGRPERKEDVSRYVLEDFTQTEELEIPALIDQAIALIT